MLNPFGPPPGQIVLLNGVPRSGKTSIADALQARGDRAWVALGADASIRSTPERLRPGVGLRPGGERPDLEPAVAALYAALFDTVAAHARAGLDLVVDVGLHESYASPLAVRAGCARRLAGLPVLVVGVHCPLEVIWQRRLASWGQDPAAADVAVRAAVERWQHAVHAGMPYDLQVDTSVTEPDACAERIAGRVREGPPGTALARLNAE